MKESKSYPERKNYPGDLRTPGTKDYGLILGNLMNYRNQLIRETEEQKAGKLFEKISEKLQELGFSRASNLVKNRVGEKKGRKYVDITLKKKNEVVEVARRYWHEGKDKHEKAKEENKKKKALS